MEQSIPQHPGAPLPFEAAENFRELGGYPAAGGKHVKHGVFYRSGALEEAVRTPHDKALLESLGLKVICDLRSSQERAHQPDPAVPGAVRHDISAIVAADGQEVNFDLASFFTMTGEQLQMILDGVLQSYARLPLDNEAYRAMFAEIERGNVPLLFHCTAGKDRTGVAAMLILKALGASDEVAMEDYLRTNECRRKTRAALALKFQEALGDGEFTEEQERIIGMFGGVEEKGLRLAMDAIRERYPSFEAYFEAEYGLDEEKLARLRGQYLE